MRLIRLTTENENCFFESIFNSDLTIKPYSKVALSSFTTQLDNLNMVIDSQNNEISYSVDGDTNAKTLTLPNGVYTSSDVDDFWLETTRLFNTSMSNAVNQINRQWRCSILGGRAAFELKSGTVVAPLTVVPTNLYSTKNLITGGAGGGKMKRATAGIGNDAFLYIKSPNNKGASSLRSTIFSDNIAGTQSGFVLGYTASNPSVTTTVINPTSYLYAIRYVDLTQPYKIIINGVETATITTPEIGDIITIDIFGGEIYYRIYKSGSAIVISLYNDNIPYDHQADLYPLLLFVGSDTTMYNTQFTSDPYYNITNTTTEPNVVDNNLTIVPLPNKQAETKCFLQFNSPDLATVLGFKKSRYPDAGFESKAEPTFLAELPFSLRDFSESYVVELLNIKLDSMDSLTQGQRSILYLIPQLSQIKEHVVFQVPQLIFLNINNRDELSLREIRARVLKNNLTQFTCYGLSELVLIIKEKDEL
jgi:hypothetical protein